MSIRYAIYWTPAPNSALWHLASAWLGRDSHANRSVARPATLDVAPADLATATAHPARYGFHATLVAPFELAAGASEAELVKAVADFCTNSQSFRSALKVDRIHDFLALVPVGSDPRLDALAAACVHAFDRFRAPLSEADLARRSSADLSDRERALLQRWGYAHVLEAFRFHLSLSGALPDEIIARLKPKLTALFDAELQQAVDIDGLSLLKQPDRGGNFHCIARHDFVPVETVTELEIAP